MMILETMIAGPALVFFSTAIWFVSAKAKSKALAIVCVTSGIASLAASVFYALWFAM